MLCMFGCVLFVCAPLRLTEWRSIDRKRASRVPESRLVSTSKRPQRGVKIGHTGGLGIPRRQARRRHSRPRRPPHRTHLHVHDFSCRARCLAAWLLWLLWLPGCLAAWLPGCLAAWLPGCLAAWLLSCLVAWLAVRTISAVGGSRGAISAHAAVGSRAAVAATIGGRLAALRLLYSIMMIIV